MPCTSGNGSPYLPGRGRDRARAADQGLRGRDARRPELDLEIADGEFVVFVGPSGCGKTTALRMIAGLEDITAGTVRIGGEVVNDLPPKARDIAMVFQNYALYPHMNAYDNMAFGLKMRGIDKAEIRRRVERRARDPRPRRRAREAAAHLSGGQRQRVAMGRAIVREPEAFLMDEPLSNLDAKMRVQMRAEIARLQRDLKVTTIYVTHDQSEAMTLGDRVCVMRGGLLQQVDRPQLLYDQPANLFVAEFIGSPAMNLVEAELAERDGGSSPASAARARASREAVAAAGARGYVGRRVALGIRPEDMADARARRCAARRAVDIREDMGSEVFLHFAVDAAPVKARSSANRRRRSARGRRRPGAHHGSPFVARVDRGIDAREGEQAQLTSTRAGSTSSTSRPGPRSRARAEMRRRLLGAIALALAWTAPAHASCPPPQHPPPVTTIIHPRWLPGVLITEYYPAPERWFHDRLVRAPGLPGRHHAGWLYSARGLAMQGEGIGADGGLYHFTGPYSLTWRNAHGHDTLPCPEVPGAWTNGRPAWIERGAHFAPGPSLTLAYWHDLAVDPRLIPRGSSVFVRTYCNTPSKGWFRASDTGGAILGLHVDVFRAPPVKPWFSRVLRRQKLFVVPPGFPRPARVHC